jgi:hypothetical protein
MDYFKITQYVCSIIGVGCLGFTYYIMAKKDKKKDENQPDIIEN